MKRLLICLFAIMIVASFIQPTQASAPYGHFVIAKRVIGGIQGGARSAPDELKDIINDPDCQKAFCGGSVAPDICEEKSHYGDTGDLARSMIIKARADVKKAKISEDPEKIKQANIELAFAYGWLTHCASDLNVHPKVNAMTGDSFDYKGIGGKLAHGAVEVQLDYFLWKNYTKDGEEYDVSVPYEFLSRCVGVPAGELKDNMIVLSGKALAGAVWEQKISLTNEEMSKTWKDVIADAYSECFEFINDRQKIKNWDLDCGKISTEAFKILRDAVIAANGGKLPEDWGRNYMKYYKLVEDKIRKNKSLKPEDIIKPDEDDGKTDKPDTKPATNKKGTVDFHLPAFPKVHDKPNDADKYNIGKWRDDCVTSLSKQMEEDPERAANRDACGRIPRENRELTCSNCGFAGVHWWIDPSWSCPQCEYCTMPQDVKRADGLTYREFAAARMKLYQDKIAEIEKIAQDALSK